LASIDAFLKLAETSSDPKSWPRASMRRARAHGLPRSDAQRRERMIAVLIVIAVEVVMLLVLRAVMRPVAWDSRTGDRPVLISFVTLPKARVAPPPVVARPAVASPPGAVAATPFKLSHREASRAVTTPAPVQTAATPAPPTPTVQFYSRDGDLLVPPAPSETRAIDLQEHRSMERLLPGNSNAARADFHVNTDSRAKRVVAFIAQFTGGGTYDPCPALAQDMVNLADHRVAEMATDRYEQSCEGR